LLTLTGAPGVGKTRLALEARTTWRRSTPRRLFCRPERRRPYMTLGGGAGAGLWIWNWGASAPLPQVIAHLRRKELLLVLDNLEQLLAAAPLVRELLAACPGVRILATSRQRLHLRERTALRRRAAGARRRRRTLCCARRRQRSRLCICCRPSKRRVEQICRELDCLPLAIELCAAHVSVYTPARCWRGCATTGWTCWPTAPATCPRIITRWQTPSIAAICC
jgi:predicted ATPase